MLLLVLPRLKSTSLFNLLDFTGFHQHGIKLQNAKDKLSGRTYNVFLSASKFYVKMQGDKREAQQQKLISAFSNLVRRDREHVQLRVPDLSGSGSVPLDVLLLGFFLWSRCQRSGEEEKSLVSACQRHYVLSRLCGKRVSLDPKEPLGANPSAYLFQPPPDWLGLDGHHYLQCFSI